MNISKIQINKYVILSLLVIILGLNPKIRTSLDQITYFVLNGHLAWMPTWYKWIFGLFNHPWESKLNLFIILLPLIMSTYRKDESKLQFFYKVLLYIILYEILFKSVHYVVRHNPSLLRASPSCALAHIDLNKQGFPFPVKTFAYDSFPSGHAISITYWLFVYYHHHPHPNPYIMSAAFIFFTLPRLVGGAHWLSDIYTGIIIGIVYFKMVWYLKSKWHSSSTQAPREYKMSIEVNQTSS